MNNITNVFDAIVGFDGSATFDEFRTASRSALIANAEAQAENNYDAINSAEAEQIADAVIAYRNADHSNDQYHIRASLDA